MTARTVKFEDREWQVDLEKIGVQEAIAIHDAYGFTVADLDEQLLALNPRAMQCQYWRMLRQNGVEKPIKECEFDIGDFFTALHDSRALEDLDDVAAEPDPTLPSLPDGPPSPGPPGREAASRPRSRSKEGTADGTGS